MIGDAAEYETLSTSSTTDSTFTLSVAYSEHPFTSDVHGPARRKRAGRGPGPGREIPAGRAAFRKKYLLK